MDMEFSQEQLMLKDTVRSLIRKEFPEETVRQMCIDGEGLSALESKLVELGVSGICFPEQYGGEELGWMDVAVVIEVLSCFSIDMGMACGTNLAAGMMLLQYGSAPLVKRYLPKLISGKASACIGYAEPFMLGATPQADAKDGDDATIEIHSDTIYCENRKVKTGLLFLPVDLNGETTLAVVPLKDLKGGQAVNMVGRELLGQRVYPPQVVQCERHRIFEPQAQLMCALSNYLKFFNVMSMAGNMKTVVNTTTQYAKAREQFGQPIGKFQAIAHMIVDAKIGLDISTLYGYWLASQLENAKGDAGDLTREINMANTFVSQTYANITNTAIQVMGGYGYMNESHIERYARDARMTAFYVEDSYAQKIAVAGNLDQAFF